MQLLMIFLKEEFNADITKVINCSAVCRVNPECTDREANGAAEILPWLKHLGPLQAFISNSKNPFLHMGSLAAQGFPKDQWYNSHSEFLQPEKVAQSFRIQTFILKTIITLTEYPKISQLFPTMVTFHSLGLSQISEQIF